MTNQNNEKKTSCSLCISDIIYSILYLIILIYAIYLSIKCNDGFNFGSFLLALFFAPIYIIYHIAVENSCNN
jgi:hypothetical protein